MDILPGVLDLEAAHAGHPRDARVGRVARWNAAVQAQPVYFDFVAAPGGTRDADPGLGCARADAGPCHRREVPPKPRQAPLDDSGLQSVLK